LDLGLEVGEEGVEVAKGAGWIEGEEGSNLSEFDVEGGIEKGENAFVLGERGRGDRRWQPPPRGVEPTGRG